MEPVIDSTMRAWTNKLNEHFASSDRKIDFAPWAVWFTLPILSQA